MPEGICASSRRIFVNGCKVGVEAWREWKVVK